MVFTNFSIFNKLSTITATIALVLFLGSCAKKINFINSSVVPAARGTVKVNKDKNNNYVINLQVEHLAEAKRLSPPKNMYVVWMITDKNEIKNIGQIKTPSNLKANFDTKSAFKPTKIFITAEDDADIQNPISPVVISTDVFYSKN